MKSYRSRMWVILGLVGAACASQPARAQNADPLVRPLELGSRWGSLPLWEKPATESLDRLFASARQYRSGIMIIGGRGFGTGFVISRQHRLVATNAHVADILHTAGSLTAVLNETAATYKVVKVWYHPGLYRISPEKKLVRSTDPKDGRVFTQSPDVAVLQLAEEGPALPLEFPLATAEEIEDLFARPLGMLGYPGHDTPDLPDAGRKPVATFHHGVACRLTDFNLRPDVESKRRQYVQHTAASWPGFSGSPLFLPNGHVAAIHNSANEEVNPNNPTQKTWLPHGIRVDCLWELLTYHQLDRKVPLPLKGEDLVVDRFAKPDPTGDNFRQALAKNDEARDSIGGRQFERAVKSCEEGIKLAPDCPDLYYTLALASTKMVSRDFLDRPYENPEKKALIAKVLNNIKRYVELAPSDPEGPLFYVHMVTAIEGDINQDLPADKRTWDVARKMIPILTGTLSSENLTDSARAAFLSKRGLLRARLGETQEGLKDLDKAIEIAPRRRDCYYDRALYWHLQGEPEKARKEAETRQWFDDLENLERSRKKP